MSEEVKIKISQPMFEVEELEVFDNNIHNIVEEYSKMILHEKEQILTQRIIMKQEEEIERLNEELEIRDILIKGIDKRIDNHFRKIDRCVFEDTNKLIEIQDLIKKSNGK